MKKWNLVEPITDYEHGDNGAGGKYKGKLVLRPSSIDSFIRCPYSFYKQQLLGEYGAPNSASQVGTALHAVMEDVILAKLDSEAKDYTVDDMQRSGMKHWRELNDKADIQYHGDQTYQSMSDDLYAGVLGLEQALTCVGATAAEGRYSVKIDEHPIFGAMSGSLDVEEGADVVDLKFTGKKKSKVDDYILQQSTYVWLKQINGQDAKAFSILNIIRPTKARKAKHEVDTAKNEKLKAQGKEYKEIGELVADWHIMEGKPNIPYVQHWVNIILNKTEAYANFRESLVAVSDDRDHNEKELAGFAELLFQGTSPSNSFLCNNTWCSHYQTCPHVEALRDAEQFEEVELFGAK